MKRFSTFLSISALSVGLAAPVLAVGVEEKREEVLEQQQDVQDVTQAHRATRVIGMDVKNREGEKLGEITDLVLDFDTAQVAYVVISSGGVTGIGDKLRAAPLRALSLSDKMDVLVLNVDKTAWKNAPAINKDDWPGVMDKEWLRQVNAYYH
jgi:sporulation protein YlmC with PRC-barrel domain